MDSEATTDSFPLGQRVSLPGHFQEPVILEAVRHLGAGYECRVRLLDGTPDETILSENEAQSLLRQAPQARRALYHPMPNRYAS